MKNQKSQSGITLIALVVTIVVLLILAGVTIVYVLSDNSIFKAANDAVTETDKSLILEYASNAQSALFQDTYIPGNTPKTAEQYINAAFPTASGCTTSENSVTIADGSDALSGTVKITKNGYEYTVTFTNGIPTISEPTKVK